MKKNKILLACYILIILLLLAGGIYFYSESNKPNFRVSIGTPVSEDAVNFGQVIKDKKVVNDITLGLINSSTIDQPKIVEKLPDANIRIDDAKEGVCYIWLKVWIDGDNVIFTSENENAEYKKTNGSWGEALIEYIKEYKMENHLK